MFSSSSFIDNIRYFNAKSMDCQKIFVSNLNPFSVRNSLNTSFGYFDGLQCGS